MTEVYLGLGSNLGCKPGHIRRAARLLELDERIQNVELSPLYRTAPVGRTDQDWFVNAALRLETDRSPEDLLELCLHIEQAMKRERRERWGPRTLDIDILLFGEERVERQGLVIPHPSLLERAFVLAPLLDLNPNLEIAGESLRAALRRVGGQAIERLEPVVAIVGASDKPDRYANRAQRVLMENGFRVAPVSPTGKAILGVEGHRDLRHCQDPVDTVTLYVGSARVEELVDSVREAGPRRVIFNPGTENAAARKALAGAGIETVEDCTLVMLRAGTF